MAALKASWERGWRSETARLTSGCLANALCLLRTRDSVVANSVIDFEHTLTSLEMLCADLARPNRSEPADEDLLLARTHVDCLHALIGDA